MNEKIKNAFEALGFELNEVGESGYHFSYEGIHYLWLPNADEDFLNIVIPNVADKDGVDELMYYKVMDKLNSTLKYTKANTVGDNMWLCYERELVGETDFEELIRHVILHLEHSFRFLNDSKTSDEDTADEDADEPYSTNETENNNDETAE